MTAACVGGGRGFLAKGHLADGLFSLKKFRQSVKGEKKCKQNQVAQAHRVVG